MSGYLVISVIKACLSYVAFVYYLPKVFIDAKLPSNKMLKVAKSFANLSFQREDHA